MALKQHAVDKLKRRYLLMQDETKEHVEAVILEYLGVLGWAQAKPLFLASQKKNMLILAVDRKALSLIRAAFEASKKPIRIAAVSGTLKGLEKRT